MASQQLEKIMKKLDMVTKKQDKYEQLFLKNEQDTAGTSFTGKTIRSDQQKKLVELSTLIDSIKDEIGRLAKAMEKQEQDLDDLEQYGRSNCLILHVNNLDRRISNRETEKYVPVISQSKTIGGKINKNDLPSLALKRQQKSFVMLLRQLKRQLKSSADKSENFNLKLLNALNLGMFLAEFIYLRI